MNPTVKWITRTAILLALTVLFQSLRVLIPVMPANISQYGVSLVNLCLILAVNHRHQGWPGDSNHCPCNCFFQGFTPIPVLVVP